MFPAARKGDPLTHDMIVPSGAIGPPISGPCPGTKPVFIEGLPAAHVTCTAVCSGAVVGGAVHPPPPGPPPPVLSGSVTVHIHGKPAARWAPSGDIAACGAFLGDLKLSPIRTVFIGGASIGAVAPAPLKPPSAAREFGVWLHNIFASDENQIEIYGNGFELKGTAEFRAQARAALDMLGRLPSGSQLLSNIDKSGKTVTIQETKEQNGWAQDKDRENAQNGKGSDVEVSWNPNFHELYPGGAVKDKPGSSVILAHELVHTSHMTDGTANLTDRDRGAFISEERATAGTGGTSVINDKGQNIAVPDHSKDSPTENTIRDDLGIPRRTSYLNPNRAGGAPW